MVESLWINQEMAIETSDSRFTRHWNWEQKKLKFWWARLLAMIVVIFASVPASAVADFVYCDVDGSHFDAIDISEISASPDAMFGQPKADDSNIAMPGFGFRSEAIGNMDFHAGLMEMTVFAEPGELFDGIKVTGFGTFLNFGSTATSLIHTSAFVEVNGEVFSANSLFQQNGTGVGNWEQEFEFSFPETDSFRLVIDSQILATAAGTDVAFIDQGGLAVSFNSVSSVPEPDAWLALVSTVLFGLIFNYRRKRAMKTQTDSQ